MLGRIRQRKTTRCAAHDCASPSQPPRDGDAAGECADFARRRSRDSERDGIRRRPCASRSRRCREPEDGEAAAVGRIRHTGDGTAASAGASSCRQDRPSRSAAHSISGPFDQRPIRQDLSSQIREALIWAPPG
jgi:hypothetical protein